MKTSTLFWLVTAAAWIVADPAMAQEQAKANATGIWRWSFTTQDGTTYRPVLVLKQEGEKLSGTASYRPGAEIPISGGIVQGDLVEFQVIREREGTEIATRFRAKLQGDILKGTMEARFGGEQRSFEWEAKRERGATGLWEWSFTTPGGQTFTSKLNLKQAGDKLAGTLASRDGTEIPIEDGKIKQDEISFQVTRDRDGQKYTSRYQGKLSGDTIDGTVDFNFGGQSRARPWEAKRAAGSAFPLSTP